MTKLHVLSITLIVAVFMLSNIEVKAAEEKKGVLTNSNTEVLGQKQKLQQKEQQDAQALFEESLRQLMPPHYLSGGCTNTRISYTF